MSRVKRGTTANKRRKNLLKYTKGFKWGRNSKYKLAKDAMYHAWSHAFRSRKAKKRDFRQLWEIKINSACRKEGITYSKFINGLKKQNIGINRKMLSELAQNNYQAFKEIVENAKK